MPTPVPVNLGSIITLTGADLSGAITSFFAIGLVGTSMLLVFSLRFGPRVWQAIKKVWTR